MAPHWPQMCTHISQPVWPLPSRLQPHLSHIPHSSLRDQFVVTPLLRPLLNPCPFALPVPASWNAIPCLLLGERLPYLQDPAYVLPFLESLPWAWPTGPRPPSSGLPQEPRLSPKCTQVTPQLLRLPALLISCVTLAVLFNLF